MILEDDYPDPSWYPEMPGYLTWKERQTPLGSELFLPRNLVDDLHLPNWNDAETYLKAMEIIFIEDLDLDEYKRAFDALVQKNHQP